MQQTKAMCINFFSILDFLSSPTFSMENSYCTEFYTLHMSKNGFSNWSKTDLKTPNSPFPSPNLTIQKRSRKGEDGGLIG
jgi:hypothetical protein